jgi:hypothetical protein
MTLRLTLMTSLMSLILGGQAMADAFPTRAEAMDYIATALPNATSENPKYLTKADGTVSVWLTESVRFAADAAGAVTVTMRERFTQTQGVKTTDGRHEASFSLAAVTVSEFAAPWDVTPTGGPALGLLFACLKPGCVAAQWGDAPSRADKADIYVQDEGARARLLAAFRRLQAP